MSADAMFASAADVLGTLVDQRVTSAPCEASTLDGSVRVESEMVATLTQVPAAGFSFVTRYQKKALARVVELMLGTPAGDGEMDAMQLSIVAETVEQISSAMAEKLTQLLGVGSENIASTVPTDSAAFPAPPFEAFTATLDVGGTFNIDVGLYFDGVAQSKMAAKSAASPEPPPAAERSAGVPEPPAAEPAAAAPPVAPARPQQPPPPSQPASFPLLAPTPVRPAQPGKANLDLVHDIPLEISAVLGGTALSLRDVVALQSGSVLELDKLWSEPIDLYVNDILIARGEVVVVDEKFAVKISELNPAVEKV